MKRKAVLLVALLATTALTGCGGGKKSSSTPAPSSSSVEPEISSSSAAPSSSSLEPSSSSSLAPSSSSSAAPSSSSSALPSSSSSALPSSSSSAAPSSSSSEAPSSSSEAPSSSSEAPSSSSSNPGPTPIVPIDPDLNQEFGEDVKNYPDEILVNNRVVSVLVGETFKIEALPQFNFTGKDVNFASSDENIATVDENGTVTGVAGGETTVVVSAKDKPDLKENVRIFVAPQIEESEAKALNTDFAAIAKQENITKITDNEMYIKTIYKNGVLHTYDRWDQRITASKEDAYFRIWETDAEIKTDNAAMDFTNYEWLFTTNVFYDTYIYHQTGDVKNYLPVATQSYMSDPDRTKPLIDILDNIFTSGSGLFNNIFENCSMEEMSDRIGISQDNVYDVIYGSNKNNDLIFAFTATFDDTADLDDENRYGIQYGTRLDQKQVLRYTVQNNRVLALAIDLEETYSFGGDDYVAYYHIEHSYEDVDELYMPNKKDYTRVDDLYSL